MSSSQFAKRFVVPRKDKRGGLAMVWRSDFYLSTKSFSLNHIDAIIDEYAREAWRLTCFNGELEIQDKETLWNLLRRLKG